MATNKPGLIQFQFGLSSGLACITLRHCSFASACKQQITFPCQWPEVNSSAASAFICSTLPCFQITFCQTASLFFAVDRIMV